MLARYSPSDIFNADEIGLYVRALPEHTYAFKSDKAKGAKTIKERFTILCCVSMDEEKRKLMEIIKRTHGVSREWRHYQKITSQTKALG